MDQYKDYSFSMQDTILGMTSSSQSQFEAWWSKQVATELGLDESTIAGLYDRNTDVHNSEWRIREMWKYATAKGVNATPTVFINGVHVDAVPFSVDDWMALLNQIYATQWHPSTESIPSNDACPIKEGSASFWCQESTSCIAGFPNTSYTCDGGQTCCEHYCAGGICDEEEPVNEACPIVEGSASFWCQDSTSCIAGFPNTSYTCDGGQTCCEHYCAGGICDEEEPVNEACPIVEGSASFWC